ncbi:hypothetical protein HFO89_10895 [Rhizobium leguminosarum]|uniref:hypothetical protein n=1 Tax=Rhizobium leguminosarum TaxID=384 RepID=UPI001C954347|nr:hypothetical protein [Rhizobium leguminosarum]MBY5456867.1 hypothetical protein [Rhizobium leguminosarum]
MTIIDSVIPLQDSWVPDDPGQWDSAGGAVSSWASGGVYLTGPAGLQSIFLANFRSSTTPPDSGSGEKNYDDGSFPMGTFAWRCLSKD